MASQGRSGGKGGSIWAAVLGATLVMASPAFAQLERGEPGCRPEMAGFREGAPRVILAKLNPGEVRLEFIGHSTFLIETPQGVTAATDYNDYIRPSGTPVVATMNRAHTTHYSNRPDPGIKHLLPGWGTAGARVDHDVTEGDMRVRNVATNIRDWNGNTSYDANSIFIFEVGELCIGHLGHLHHTLEPEHLRAMGRLDVVLAPVDGNYTLDLDGMIDVLRIVQARVVIPMHYFGPTTLERFLTRAGQDFAIDRRGDSAITVSKETLPARPTVVVLPGR